MITDTQVQRLYNAIVVRGTRSVPTYAEVASDARRDAINRMNIEARF